MLLELETVAKVLGVFAAASAGGYGIYRLLRYTIAVWCKEDRQADLSLAREQQESWVREQMSQCRMHHEMLVKESSGAVQRLERKFDDLGTKMERWGEQLTGVKLAVARMAGKLNVEIDDR